MAFVHGHPRETGWVVSHYRRPQLAGDDQLALPSPRPRAEDDDPERDDAESADAEPADAEPADAEPADAEP